MWSIMVWLKVIPLSGIYSIICFYTWQPGVGRGGGWGRATASSGTTASPAAVAEGEPSPDLGGSKVVAGMDVVTVAMVKAQHGVLSTFDLQRKKENLLGYDLDQ